VTTTPTPECANCERLQAELAAVKAEHEALKAEHEALKARLAALEARLGQNSQNSHRPPSSDPPGAPRAPKRKPSGRKRGGQRGHKGHSRELLPTEQVAQVVACKPSECRECGSALLGDDPAPERHQVAEIPKIVATVTEYQLHELECPCGATTRGRLPEGVTYSPFGPRLQALVTMMSGVYRLSKRNIQSLMRDCLSVSVSVGSISNLEMEMSRALAAPVEEAREAVREQTRAHADETGWRQAGKKAWLWTVVTGVAVVFAIRFSRGAKVAKELLGECFAGILNSDRWSSYNWVDLARRQLCWAHLIRDFRKIAESRGPLAPVGKSLGKTARELFRRWHRVRDGTLSRADFQRWVAEVIRPEVQRLLAVGASASPETARRGMCLALQAVEPAMWTFVTEDDVEPTNNRAERAIRHGVIWRRTSFGTQSDAGSRYVERVLTTVATLRLQGRNVLEYMTEVIDAANRRKPGPRLVDRV
jgi:transposase